MDRPTTSSRTKLRSIARRAMIQRGLLPEFSPAVLAETNAIADAAVETGASIRDLRDRLWASIDLGGHPKPSFRDRDHAFELITRWLERYHAERPHSALGCLSRRSTATN